MIDDEPGNVSRSGGEISNSSGLARFEPTFHKLPNEFITAEKSIQLSQIFQIPLKLTRDRLRPIHQFRYGRIEASLHRSTIVAGCDRRLLPPVFCGGPPGGFGGERGEV